MVAKNRSNKLKICWKWGYFWLRTMTRRAFSTGQSKKEKAANVTELDILHTNTNNIFDVRINAGVLDEDWGENRILQCLDWLSLWYKQEDEYTYDTVIREIALMRLTRWSLDALDALDALEKVWERQILSMMRANYVIRGRKWTGPGNNWFIESVQILDFNCGELQRRLAEIIDAEIIRGQKSFATLLRNLTMAQ